MLRVKVIDLAQTRDAENRGGRGKNPQRDRGDGAMQAEAARGKSRGRQRKWLKRGFTLQDPRAVVNPSFMLISCHTRGQVSQAFLES